MTKERRLAIQMWEEIAETWENDNDASLTYLKSRFCNEYHLLWLCDCWFCQYVRQNYKPVLPSRRDIPRHANGCQKCPIYREAPRARGDICGCHIYAGGVWKELQHGDKVKAARHIAELLRNEKED